MHNFEGGVISGPQAEARSREDIALAKLQFQSQISRPGKTDTCDCGPASRTVEEWSAAGEHGVYRSLEDENKRLIYACYENVRLRFNVRDEFPSAFVVL